MTPSQRHVAIETQRRGSGIAVRSQRELPRKWHLNWDLKGRREEDHLLQRKQLVQKDQSLKQHVPQESVNAPRAGAETSGQAPAKQCFSQRGSCSRDLLDMHILRWPQIYLLSNSGMGPSKPLLRSPPANCDTQWSLRTIGLEVAKQGPYHSRLSVSWGPRYHQVTWSQPRIFSKTVTGSDCILEKSFQYSIENKIEGRWDCRPWDKLGDSCSHPGDTDTSPERQRQRHWQ